ncbi:MAG TPA: HlyD family efflux transporter periplasmic adaptor subunit, partial [Niabella sp.]
TGRLIRLFVTNGEQVKRNDKIAWIESTTNPEEALQLSAQLDSTVSFLIDGKIEKIPDLYKEHFKNLGNIQAAYQTYTTALQQFTDYYINGFYNRKKQMLLHNMTSISKMSNELDKQKNLELKDSQIADNTFKMYERLYKEKVISLSEYRQEESRLINNQKSIPQINSSILSNQNQQRDQLKDLEQLDHDIAQQKMTFEQSLQTLKSSIDEWKRQCIVTAPVDGTLVYALPVQQNQFVEQGKLLAYVNPGDNNSHMFVYLAQGNLGKIDTGMQVQLRFDAYPYQEAGFVIGHLNYISRISSDSGYLSTIRLDNGLQTNIKKNIEYKNGLKATALIITRDMRLLQRLYYDMIKSTSIGR